MLYDSISVLARAAEPLPKCHSTGAQHYAQCPSEAPQGRFTVKENKLKDKCQHHIHSPHQGHGSSLLNLQGLREEGLASNSQNSNQNQHPAILAAEWDFPFPKDGNGDDAFDETNDSIVPHRQVVMDTFPHLAKDNKCTSSSNCSYNINLKNENKLITKTYDK